MAPCSYSRDWWAAIVAGGCCVGIVLCGMDGGDSVFVVALRAIGCYGSYCWWCLCECGSAYLFRVGEFFSADLSFMLCAAVGDLSIQHAPFYALLLMRFPCSTYPVLLQL